MHLGLKQESSGGFDPSKFATKPAAPVAEEKVATPKARVEEESTGGDDDEIADKDFLEELRRLG
ncbi:MAG: hypothetical protein EBU90_21340 [Proteobacteria bacterium]|nr:hypothetical protein [Pseudomonadota bacterium]